MFSSLNFFSDKIQSWDWILRQLEMILSCWFK